MTVMPDPVTVRRVTIVNALGLHARAASKFVQLAECYDAEITVIKKDTQVSGASILDLMMLGAAKGCDLELRASGIDAEPALRALAALIANRFGEKG